MPYVNPFINIFDRLTSNIKYMQTSVFYRPASTRCSVVCTSMQTFFALNTTL